MIKRPAFSDTNGYGAFHAIAAERGDGLHPLLLEALGKSGHISGPPAPSEQNDNNVVRCSFGRDGQMSKMAPAQGR